MSKLSPSLKALINAPFARPGYTKPPSNIRSVFQQLSRDAARRGVGMPAWITLSTATTMTMNAPEALAELFKLTQELNCSSASSTSSPRNRTTVNDIVSAELIREVGLKCISFNGIPRTINCLGSFHSSLPKQVQTVLSRRSPSRELNAENVQLRQRDGRKLWNSVYAGVEERLLSKLAQSHPDLPVYILNSHYGSLLSDPSASPGEGESGRESEDGSAVSTTGDGGPTRGSQGKSWTESMDARSNNRAGDLNAAFGSLRVSKLNDEYSGASRDSSQNYPVESKVGRVLTSIVAVACLRTQTGVGPQVISHILGLRKAYEMGDAKAAGEPEVEGGEWLATTDEGNKWLLESVDEIVRAISSSSSNGYGPGTSFAPGMGRSKL